MGGLQLSFILVGALGVVLSVSAIGLYIGFRLKISHCERLRRQADDENERLVRNARG